MTIFLVSFWHEPALDTFAGPVRVWELAKAWVARGHRVHAFVPNYRGVAGPPGVRVHRLPVLDFQPLRAASFYALSALALLAASFRHRPRLIYMRTMPNPLPLLVARLRRIAFFVEVNDDIFQAHVRRRLAGTQRRAVELFERMNCRGATAVIVEVDEIARALIERWGVHPERIVPMPGGTDPDLFRPRPARESRIALDLPEAAWVGFVGTLYRYQGLHTLIEAAPRILASVPNARFLIVGSGEAEAELREAVNAAGLDHVFRFTGWVPYGDVPRYTTAMDVCVVPLTPDRGDAIPMKAFDYMAAARPIVIGADPSSMAIWKRWPGVLYVEPGKPDALADATVRLLRDPALREELGEANRRAVEEEYAWSSIADRVVELCDRLAPPTIYLLAFWHEPSLPTFSGPVRVLELAKALAGVGQRVEIFVPGYPTIPDLHGVRVRRIPIIDVNVVRALSFYVMSAFAIAWCRLMRRPRMLYMRTMPNPVAWAVARMLRIPFVLEVNDDLFRAHVRRALSGLRRLAVRSIERLNCRASDIVVVHVPEVGKQLARRWHIDDRRIVALPGGTNTALFHPLATAACRKAIGLGEGPLVGFVGTLYGYQGLQTLVEAAVTMRERNPGVRFLIVGSGPTEDELRATVRARGLDDAFVFTGWVPYGDVPRYINAMDVCVAPLMPDRGLAMPIKLFDYMACSRPVVVSARYDELDLWGEWPGVLYVVPGDPAALADGLLAILADPELSAAMGAANRHAVEESYSWAAIARRIATLEPTRGR